MDRNLLPSVGAHDGVAAPPPPPPEADDGEDASALPDPASAPSGAPIREPALPGQLLTGPISAPAEASRGNGGRPRITMPFFRPPEHIIQVPRAPVAPVEQPQPQPSRSSMPEGGETEDGAGLSSVGRSSSSLGHSLRRTALAQDLLQQSDGDTLADVSSIVHEAPSASQASALEQSAGSRSSARSSVRSSTVQPSRMSSVSSSKEASSSMRAPRASTHAGRVIDPDSIEVRGTDMTGLLGGNIDEDDSVLMNGEVTRLGMKRGRRNRMNGSAASDDDPEEGADSPGHALPAPELEETALPVGYLEDQLPPSRGGEESGSLRRKQPWFSDQLSPEDLDDPVYLAQVRAANEAYAREEGQVATEWQRAALGQLRQLDARRVGRFSAKQTLELVRALRVNTEASMPRPRTFRLNDYVTCSCLAWVAILIVILWIPMVIAGTLARELKAERNGVLISARDGLPTASALFLSRSSFKELQTIPEGTLRRIHDCTFVHRGAFHHLRVISLVRTSAGDVTLAAPDHSSLRIRGSLQDGAGTVSFYRPFYGVEQVDLAKMAQATEPTGCTLTALGSAPARSRPPR